MDGISLSAKAQIRYNKELGRNRRGCNRGVREVRETVREVGREEIREDVRDESEGEEEDDGVGMLQLIDDKLEEVQRKVARTNVMVRAMVR